MNNTKTVAATAIPGGTLLGAGIGALAGHGDREFDCTNESMRNTLLKELKDNQKIGAINQYITSDLSTTAKSMTLGQCREIMDLYDLWQMGKEAVDTCRDTKEETKVEEPNIDGFIAGHFRYRIDCVKETGKYHPDATHAQVSIRGQTHEACSADPCACKLLANDRTLFNTVATKALAGIQNNCFSENVANDIFESIKNWVHGAVPAGNNTTSDCIGYSSKTSAKTEEVKECKFINLNQSWADGTDVYCTKKEGCLTREEFREQLKKLDQLFNSIEILAGEKGNRLKTTLVGAGIGAATGGTATAITAFVEKNNINCRVADGLARVSFGKSYTIDRLRDFYVKWALNLPSTIAPTAVVTNCDNWSLTCALFTDANECRNAKFNYRPGNLSSTTLINNPCTPSGSACIANLGVAQSNGVCLVNPTPNPNSDEPDPNAGFSRVSNCDEWINACKLFTNATDCNSAKVIYVPRSMRVSNACKYQSAIKECRPSAQKAKQYLDINNCPIRLE